MRTVNTPLMTENQQSGDPDKGKPAVCHLTTRLIKGGADFNILYTLLGSYPHFEQTLVVGAEYDEELIQLLEEKGIEVCVFPRIRRSINPFNELLAFFSLRGFFSRRSFDLIHTHNAKTGILGRCAVVKRKINKKLEKNGGLNTQEVESASRKFEKTHNRPVIIHGIHGMSFTASMPLPVFLLFRQLERIAARRTDYFVSVGSMIRDLMLENGIGRVEQYRVINSGMNLDAFSKATMDVHLRESLGFTPEDIVVTVLARLERRKGQREFLESFSNAAASCGSEQPLKALIVGDGPDRELLVQRIHQPDLKDRVVMSGFRSDPEAMIGISDFLCLSSQWEGVPQSLVQAAAAGKPVVAFDVPGIREIVVENKTGLVVPYPDVDALGNAICKLASDTELRERMKEAVKKLDLSRFRREVMVKKTVEFYKEALVQIVPTE